jgi:phage shock protein A
MMGTNYPDSISRSQMKAIRKILHSDVPLDEGGASGWQDVETLVNELKADYTSAKTLVNSLKAKYNALQLEVADLRARMAEVKTLTDEFKTDYSAHLSASHPDSTNTISASGITAITATAATAEANADAGSVSAADLT